MSFFSFINIVGWKNKYSRNLRAHFRPDNLGIGQRSKEL